MNKKEIKDILNKKYNRNDWKNLAKNIFKNVEYFKEPKKILTNNDKILDFLQIGNLNLNDNKTISLFELKLTKNLNIYKNKIELRNIVTKFIDQYSSHGVLVVFDNQGSDYRLTFSSKYSEFDQEGNIIEVETAPKRYTYLLGENESCTTPAERLHLLHNQKNNLKIEDILNAFNVNKITDDFFNTYKKLYLKLYDEIELLIKKDKNIKYTFEKNFITKEEFSKKLLGQLVFIYFLQKKGWLGLKKNDDGIFKKWGLGDKNFIRNLFNKKYCKFNNFFNDVLEPLFVAFSTDLPENYYSKLDTKIPFLNGGLFDPIKNYNWLDTKITISNELINEILDNFEMYNFTIQEEDPDETEVAIDPEMLGKVFENLLDIKDKKSKGTFYTPRKIAKYICEEALINYLINEFGNDSKDQITQIVKNVYEYKKTDFIKKNFKSIDEKIKNIKICDPAIGSGEFPVELMNLCVSIRLSFNNFYNDQKRTSYLLKRNFIKNSIYGVDIEDSAIETAKLRLWLSLILDEEDYDKILPLPNLDYKIFKGDSLLSLESNLLGLEKKDEIVSLKNEYFQITNIKRKLELKKKIDLEFNSIMDGQVSFDFKIFFQEVFDLKQGFDLIVGNPPYVQIQKIKDRLYKSNLRNEYKVFSGNGDLYCLFFEKGRELLNEKGCLAYITSNKWLKSAYGSQLRNFFLDKCNIIQLIDFKSLQLFKKASVDTSIVLLKKGSSNKIKACEIDDLDKYKNFEETLKIENIEIKKENLLSTWAISRGDENLLLTKIKNLKNKIDLPRTKFRRGITTGLNSVFLIDEKKKRELVKIDKKNESLIKKIVRGKNMYKYTYDRGLDYLLYIPWHFPLKDDSINGASKKAELIFKKEYKSLYGYLLHSKKSLEKRNEEETGIRYEWYALQRPGTSFVSDFNQIKVGWMNMNRGWKFSLIDKDIFLEASCNFIADNEYAKYLVGIYSSNLHKWYFKKVGRMFDDGGYMCKVDTISEFPVIKPNLKEKSKVEKIVDSLINNPKQKDEDYLNNYVCELYGLNSKEKNIIDSVK
jgi:hypothetical protein